MKEKPYIDALSYLLWSYQVVGNQTKVNELAIELKLHKEQLDSIGHLTVVSAVIHRIISVHEALELQLSKEQDEILDLPDVRRAILQRKISIYEALEISQEQLQNLKIPAVETKLANRQITFREALNSYPELTIKEKYIPEQVANQTYPGTMWYRNNNSNVMDEENNLGIEKKCVFL